jgi:hypothetical protein
VSQTLVQSCTVRAIVLGPTVFVGHCACVPIFGENGFSLPELFRPEFVAQVTKPLSSDAYTGFGGCAKCSHWQCQHAVEIMHDAVIRAAGRLFSQTVPEFAQQLNDGTLRFADNAQLVQLLHAAGINFRFMGYVRNRVTFQWARECLLSEMICRVLRGLFRAELRRIRHTGDHRMVADVVLSFFNHALGSSVDSDMFWVKVKQRLSDKYVGVEALSEAERESGYDLRLSVSVGVFVEG